MSIRDFKNFKNSSFENLTSTQTVSLCLTLCMLPKHYDKLDSSFEVTLKLPWYDANIKKIYTI